MAKNWMRELSKLDKAVADRRDRFKDVIRSSSPSFNFIFGKTHGLPRGYGCLMWGASKSGKSTVANDIIGQVHRDYPEGYVVKFDTEERDEAQLTPEAMKVFGIDPERYIAIASNSAAAVFDQIAGKLSALIDDGMDLPLIVIDSLSGIRGRRDEANTKGIESVQRGDRAQTIGDGLKAILDTQRQRNFALLALDHARAEMDEWEIKRNGHAYKMASASAAQHHFEYVVYADQWKAAKGRVDLLGNDLVDASVKDLSGKEQQIGHKARARMTASTFGPKMRTAVFTLADNRGIVNTHEEIFSLAVNRGLATVSSNGAIHEYAGQKWKSKAAFAEACRDPALQSKIKQDLLAAEGRNTWMDRDTVKEAQLIEKVQRGESIDVDDEAGA